MALPALRAVGAKAAGTGAVTPALPAGMSANDICILVATTIAGGSLSITANGSITTWNLLSGMPLDIGTDDKLYVWWGRWSSGSTGPTITPDSNHCCAGIAAYSGCVLNGSPIHLQATGTENTSDTSFSFATGLTTTVNDCLCLCICSTGADSNSAQFSTMTNASLANIVEDMDYCTNSGGGGGFALARGDKATAGSMGTFASTLSTASLKNYVAIALAPSVPITVLPGVGVLTLTGNANTITNPVSLAIGL